MEQNRLHTLLVALDRELKSTGALDAKSQELLERVVSDIRQLPASANLATNRATNRAGGTAEHQSAEARLRELVLRFETDHPQLSGAVGQVADALGKLGI